MPCLTAPPTSVSVSTSRWPWRCTGGGLEDLCHKLAKHVPDPAQSDADVAGLLANDPYLLGVIHSCSTRRARAAGAGRNLLDDLRHQTLCLFHARCLKQRAHGLCLGQLARADRFFWRVVRFDCFDAWEQLDPDGRRRWDLERQVAALEQCLEELDALPDPHAAGAGRRDLERQLERKRWRLACHKPVELTERPGEAASPAYEIALLRAEMGEAVRGLPRPRRELLRLLLDPRELSLQQIADILDLSINQVRYARKKVEDVLRDHLKDWA